MDLPAVALAEELREISILAPITTDPTLGALRAIRGGQSAPYLLYPGGHKEHLKDRGELIQ